MRISLGSRVRSLPQLLCMGLVLVAGASGCEDQQVIPLTPLDLTTSLGSASKARNPAPCADLSDEDRVVRQVLAALNAERAKHQLRPLKLDPTLMQLADFYACRLVDGRFFQHVDPYDGSTVDTRAADFGYAFVKIGENLAAGQRTVDQAIADWMRSPSHRANILDPAFTEVGIAVKGGGELGLYWVNEFGRPAAEPITTSGSGHPAASASSDPTSRPGDAGGHPAH